MLLRALFTTSVAFGAFFAWPPKTADAREWVGADGISFEADYVRTSGDSIVIQQGDETHVLPVRRLSEADRNWVRAAEECGAQRSWTTYRSEVIHGRYEKLEGDTVFFRTRNGRRTVPLRELCLPDRRLIAAYNEVPTPPGEAPEHGGGEPPGGRAVERVWTSTDGSKIVAEYRGMAGDKVVLFFKNREWRVDRSRFSAADQEYLDARPKRAGVLMFDELRAANGSQTNERQTNEAPTGDASGASFAESRRHVADVRRRLAEAARRGNSPQQTEPSLGPEPRVLRPGAAGRRPEVSAPASTAVAADRVRDVEEALRAPPRRRESGGSTAAAEPERLRYTCSACGKEIESATAVSAGDACPHCGATFDQLNDENGEAVEVSETLGARRTARVVKLVVFGILSLGAFLGWISRQG